jgi:hypothetical protein
VRHVTDPLTSRFPAAAGLAPDAVPVELPLVHRRGATDGRLGRAFVLIVLVSWGIAAVAGYRYGVYLLTAAGFAAALIGVYRPRLGFFGIGLLCTIDPLMAWLVFSGSIPMLRWNTFNYWLLVATVLWSPMLVRRGGAPLRWAQLFGLLLVLELAMSADRAHGLQDVFGVWALFGIVVYLTRRRFAPADWYWLGVICGTTAAGGGLLYFMAKSQLPEINPNAWAFFPVTALFALCLALPSSFRRRGGPMLLALLACISIAWAFLSGSRGALLVALLCGIYFLAAMRGLGRRAVVLGIATLTFLGAASQFTDMQKFALGRMHLLLDSRTGLADRTSHRSDLARGGWYILRTHPLGVGTGGFNSAWREVGPHEGVRVPSFYHRLQAHAVWVKLMAENGIPGLIVAGSFVLSFAVTGWRRRRRSAQLIGLLTSAAMGVSFVSTEYQNKGIWLLAAGAIALLGRTSPLLPPTAEPGP